MFSYTIGRTAVLLFALSSLSTARAMAAGDVPVPDNQTYKEIENQLKNRVDPNGKGKDWSDHNDSDPGTPLLYRPPNNLLHQPPNNTGTAQEVIDFQVLDFEKDAEKMIIHHEEAWDEDTSAEQADKPGDGLKRRQ